MLSEEHRLVSVSLHSSAFVKKSRMEKSWQTVKNVMSLAVSSSLQAQPGMSAVVCVWDKNINCVVLKSKAELKWKETASVLAIKLF